MRSSRNFRAINAFETGSMLSGRGPSLVSSLGHSPFTSVFSSTTLSSTSTSRYFQNRTDRHGNIIPIVRENVVNPIKFLPQQYTVLHERFGAYVPGSATSDAQKPGLNVFVPVIDSLVYVLNTENVYGVTHQEAITKDNASVKADGVFYYKIIDAKKAAYGVSDLQRSLENLVVTHLRKVFGNRELDEALKSREKINAELKEDVVPAAAEWGVEVTRVELREIKPEPELVHAMDKQMIAERIRRATETEALGKKNATIEAAQGERVRLESIAEGSKQADILNSQAKLEVARNEAQSREALAQADARNREVLANAEAKSIEVVDKAIKDNPAITKYFIAKETAAAFRDLAKSPNHKVLMFPSGKNSMVTPLALAAEVLGLGDKAPTPGKN